MEVAWPIASLLLRFSGGRPVGTGIGSPHGAVVDQPRNVIAGSQHEFARDALDHDGVGTHGKVNWPFGPFEILDQYGWDVSRSEEHTSELQSLMRLSYVVFCLKHINHI